MSMYVNIAAKCCLAEQQCVVIIMYKCLPASGKVRTYAHARIC